MSSMLAYSFSLLYSLSVWDWFLLQVDINGFALNLSSILMYRTVVFWELPGIEFVFPHFQLPSFLFLICVSISWKVFVKGGPNRSLRNDPVRSFEAQQDAQIFSKIYRKTELCFAICTSSRLPNIIETVWRVFFKSLSFISFWDRLCWNRVMISLIGGTPVIVSPMTAKANELF